jgi:hypothetical protein
MRLTFALSALVGLAALAGAAMAQGVPDPWAGQLAAQLARAERAFTGQGYSRVAGPFSGSLPRGGSRRFNITLRAGGDYRVVGVCDNDCRDLDMRIFDQNANLIAENTDRDDMPIVTSQPRWTGPFAVEVTMYHCAAAPCYFAFNVYGR